MKRTIPTMTTTTRHAARSDSLFLGLGDTAFARILAEAAYNYFIRTGEAHRDAPKTPSIQRAISDYDGSTESEDRIDNAYYMHFVDNPPPPKFLSYAAELLKDGTIGRDVLRRDRTTLPTQLVKVKNLIPEELADAAMQYVFRTGEGHPDAPDTTDIRKTLSANDGSDGAVHAIRESYQAAFTRTPPSEAFLRYAEGLVRTNQIVRRKGKPSRLAYTQATHRRYASTGQECHFYKANDDKWYMGLSDYPPEDDEERDRWGGEIEDWYGPFATFDEAYKYLHDDFANPGGYTKDDSGRRPPPKRDHNNRFTRFAHAVAARWLAASDGQDASRWPSYLRLMPPLPPEEEPVAGYDGIVQLLRRLEAGDEVEITYRDSRTGYEATSRRTVSTSWQELKDQHSDTFKRPTVLLQAKVKGRFKEGMISDYGDNVQWQPTPSTPVARVIIIRKV